MDPIAAIDQLPPAYAAALRARDKNLSTEEIAVQLGIEREAVEPLLRLATAKLGAILAPNKHHFRSTESSGDPE